MATSILSVGDILGRIWDGCRKFFLGFMPLAAVTSAVAVMVGYVTNYVGWLDTAHGAIQNAMGYVSGLNLGPLYAKVNTILPVYEMFRMVSALLSLKTICTGVRLIRSLIPGW